ncbi:MAG: amidohydrolase family protein [Actinobacteria bacterium]|nr:amidohydrolase family protein [Actinomycetota bacterium]
MRTRFLLRGGCVLTLGAKTPNFARADVLIEDGRVAEVGPGVRARDAEPVDAADTIVMPGFVDTHRHAWRSLLRNLGAGSDTAGGETPAPAPAPGEHHRPEDIYAAVLIGLLGAVEAGITTVVDWSDIPAEDGFADAALQAHADAGLRTVLAYAAPRPAGSDGDAGAPTRELLTRLAAAAGPSTTIALGSGDRGPGDLGRIAGEWSAARELGSPIHVHAGPEVSGRGLVADLAGEGLLGADVTMVHCTDLRDADLDAIAAAGASVSLAPSSEMASGRGSPPIQQVIDRGIRPGLGIDDERFAPGDMFAQMRATISMQHATVFELKLAGKAGLPRLMSTRDVIRHATVDGARVAGLGGVTGSLEPGMQADVIVLRTDRPNIFPINDPIGAVVWGMDTSNVDWVFAGGRVLMREGVLQADVERARKLATEARDRVAVAALTVGSPARGPG